MNDCLRNSTLLSWVAGNDVLLLARVYEKVLDAGDEINVVKEYAQRYPYLYQKAIADAIKQ